MSLYDQLWVEKYRPKKLDDLVLTEENRKFFSGIDENTPHLLLHGHAGTGKTTLAKIIVSDILKCQYLYINASDENGIDTIRNKVTLFAQTSSLDGKKKVIILDEFCGTTNDAQRILRSVMEEYSDTTRFILTANYLNKIIEPIQSRCLLFNIIPDLAECVKRCLNILKQEKVDIGSDIEFVTFVKNNFPDMRRIINDLQRFSINGTLVINQINEVKNIAENVYNALITKVDAIQIRKIVIENEKTFSADYQSLLKSLLDFFYDTAKIKENIKKRIILEIGEHMYRDNFVIDHEINFFCCLIAIENALLS
jgi:DNA polymerase III delta prime subunit